MLQIDSDDDDGEEVEYDEEDEEEEDDSLTHENEVDDVQKPHTPQKRLVVQNFNTWS